MLSRKKREFQGYLRPVCMTMHKWMISSYEFPFAGHFLMHCDAFHHQNSDPPPALPVRSLRKVQPSKKMCSHDNTIWTSWHIQTQTAFLPPHLPSFLFTLLFSLFLFLFKFHMNVHIHYFSCRYDAAKLHLEQSFVMVTLPSQMLLFPKLPTPTHCLHLQTIC